jgi:hypothetical protein
MTKTGAPSFIRDLALFLAGRPTRQGLLGYRASRTVQRRANHLLEKQCEKHLTCRERSELEGYAFAERLMRLIKARVRARQMTNDQ